MISMNFFIWVFLIPTEIIVFVSLCSSLSSHNQLVKADFLEQIFSSPLSSIDEDTVKGIFICTKFTVYSHQCRNYEV